MTEYRVVWRRVGELSAARRTKRRTFKTRFGAERFLKLFGPEPWMAYLRPGEKPDDWRCCSGSECGCRGETIRGYHEATRASLPPLERVWLEAREVGKWEEEVQ